jgi:hypothetical protein
MSEGKHTPEPRPLSKARIVACVKACEGINPEAVKDMVGALEGIQELEESRDLPGLPPDMMPYKHAVAVCLAALRKARERTGE